MQFLPIVSVLVAELLGIRDTGRVLLYGTVFLIMLNLALIGYLLHKKRQHSHHNGLICRTCRYDLRGVDSIPLLCPECGKVFDPKEPLF